MKKYLLYIIPLFIFAFTFTGGPPSGWYQQFLPDVGGRQIADIAFTDSLTGYIVTTRLSTTDTSLILKTTNGGDNWTFIHSDSGYIYKRIQFINQNTGYVGGTHLIKTTNGGDNWFNVSSFIFMQDIHVLNEDTMWYVDPNGLTGGVFRTTNGGMNWTNQLNLGSLNPTHVYFYNGDLGFIAKNTASPYLRKTTDGGSSWNVIPDDNGFTDLHFINDLTGWKCGTSVDSIRKTTDGGDTWLKQTYFSSGGFFNLNTITAFSFIGTDTIYGVGARASTSLGFRGLIYISTNGGQTWGYQLPDTSNINISRYSFVNFTDKNHGWAYSTITGVHTITGGDTTIYVGVHPITSEVPTDFYLYQNYPNPFNPKTTIQYSIQKSSEVKISVFDITGKNIIDLVKQRQDPGTYAVDFPGIAFSSGIYFYSLSINGLIVDSKRMILVK